MSLISQSARVLAKPEWIARTKRKRLAELLQSCSGLAARRLLDRGSIQKVGLRRTLGAELRAVLGW